MLLASRLLGSLAFEQLRQIEVRVLLLELFHSVV